MNFEFATATRIIFGTGSIAKIPSLAKEFGERALVVTGSKPERADKLVRLLETEGFKVFTYSVSGEPAIDTIIEGTALAKKEKCEMVLGFGGGSVLDTGKAIGALLTNKGELMDYLEVIGKGESIREIPAPYIAIPTTAGTGAEVTRNAVVRSPEHKVKVSMRSLLMLPRIALVDPSLSSSMPPSVTASTGLDALTQLIEPYVCNSPNPITDAICREGIKRAARSLLRAYERGDDMEAREDMALAGLFSGIALANAKLGAAHGFFAGPLGGMFPAPHGVICAKLLPFVMKANVKALKEREGDSPAADRFFEVAEMLTGRSGAGLEEALEWLDELCSKLSVPSLSAFGLSEEALPDVVEKAKNSSSMKGNPVKLTEEELTEILKQAI